MSFFYKVTRDILITFRIQDEYSPLSGFECNYPICINDEQMDIQYAYTILYVKDVPRTVKFYKQAFGFEQKLMTPEEDYAEIISGSTTIAFASTELGRSNFKMGFMESSLDEKPFGIELAFTTSKVSKTINNAIVHGATLLEEVSAKPWGQKVGYVRDINGFIIEICTPMKG